jgi:hypothetical protein
MIGENIRIVDWSVEQWHNFYHALFHRGAPKRTIAVIHKDGVPVKFIDSRGGSRSDLLELYSGQSMDDLIRLIYKRVDADVVYAVSYPVIRTIFADFQRTVDFEDNYVKQLFTLKDAIAREIGRGILRYPAGLHWLVDLEYRTIRKLFSAVPDDALVMLTIFGEEEIWTNWIIGIVAFFMDHQTFGKLVGSKRKLHFLVEALSTKKIISKALPAKYRIVLFLRRLFDRKK